MGSGGGQFAATRWSLVLAARSSDAPRRRAALDDLIRAYWYPLYSYVRRRGKGEEEARDLTQGFFARLLERDDMALADPDRGRFRTWLLTAMQHYMVNDEQRGQAQKRGGGQPVLSLDLAHAEGRFAAEPGHDETPERIFTRSWALELVDRAMESLQAEWAGRGRRVTFERLQEFVTARGTGYEDAARDLGLTSSAVKVTVHRLRSRLRSILRQQIADTVQGAAAVDEELEALFEALRGEQKRL